MTMFTRLPPNQIWVWTKKAEKLAEAKGYEARKAGTPAKVGQEVCGQFAPESWVDRGFVKAAPAS